MKKAKISNYREYASNRETNLEKLKAGVHEFWLNADKGKHE